MRRLERAQAIDIGRVALKEARERAASRTECPEYEEPDRICGRAAHLEGIASEKIVRSAHSTQSIPATILEVRRILYEHLGIACGLECEVRERVDAAVGGTPKPEPPAATTDPAPKP